MADPFEELFQRPRRTDTVTLAFNPEEADQLTELRQEVTRLERKIDRKPEDDEADAELREVKGKISELEGAMQTIVFHFQGIGRARSEEILKSHQPTPQQVLDAKKQGEKLQFNPETYPVALVATTCTKITTPSGTEITGSQITEEQVERLAADLSQLDWAQLFQAALMVDAAGSTVEEVGKG